MDLISILGLGSCALAWVLVLRLLTRRSDNPLAARCLAGFIACSTLFAADVIGYKTGFYQSHPQFFGLVNPFIIAAFPCLYLYVDALVRPTARRSSLLSLHFIPVLPAVLEALANAALPASAKSEAASRQLERGLTTGDELLFVGILDAYILIYLALTLHRYFTHRARLEQNREEGRTTSPVGLGFFLLAVLALNVASTILDFTPWSSSGWLALVLAGILALFTLFWILLDSDALAAPVIPSPPPPPLQTVAIAPESSGDLAVTAAHRNEARVETTPAPQENQRMGEALPNPWPRSEVDRLSKKLNRVLLEEKAYMAPDFSLPVLSALTGMSRHKTSEALKVVYGQTFYQLISKLRVQEAARQFGTRQGHSKTVSEVAFAVGFNALSAFNAAFKAEFGCTPTQFRKNIASTEAA